MTLAAVAADLGEALDVQRGLAAQVALNDKVVVDALAQLALFLVGEVVRPISILLSLGRSTPAIRAILFYHPFE